MRRLVLCFVYGVGATGTKERRARQRVGNVDKEGGWKRVGGKNTAGLSGGVTVDDRLISPAEERSMRSCKMHTISYSIA